ncbi:MAG: PAS domain S-box protein [Alphaproteobacteria bacterium]|nr:PAS domain S-box protein [Alphaproteobacteria bacterium]
MVRIKSYGVVAAASLALIVSIVAMVGGQLRLASEREAAHVHAELTQIASLVRARIEQALEQRLAIPYALAAYASVNPALSAADFALFAGSLAAATDSVRSIQLAPGNVVKHVYPLQGNEAAIGHDLWADPERRATVGAVMRAGHLVVSDPVTLKQGGRAVIARMPVYLGEHRPDDYWGLSIVVVDIDHLVAELRLADVAADIAIVSLGPDGKSPPVSIIGTEPDDPAMLAVTASATLPGSVWRVSASRRIDPTASSPADRLAYGIGLVSLVFGFLLIAFAFLGPDEQRRAISAATRDLDRSRHETEAARRDLGTTIEAMAEGICVFDRNGALVLWNGQFARLAAIDPDRLCVGLPLMDVVAAQRGAPLVNDAAVRVASADIELANAMYEGTRTAVDGRRVQIRVSRGGDEKIIFMFADVTEIEQAARQIAHSERLLRQMLNHSPLAVAIVSLDGAHRVVNARYAELFALTPTMTSEVPVWRLLADPVESSTLARTLSRDGVMAPRTMAMRSAAGTPFWGSVSTHAIEHDGVPSALIYVLDVSEIRRAQATLERANDVLEEKVRARVAELAATASRLSQEIEERKAIEVELRQQVERNSLLAAAIENDSSGITIADASTPDLPLIYVNRAFTTMTGYAPAEVIGRNCRFLSGAETAPESRQAIREALRDGTPISLDLVNYRKGGEKFWNQLTLFPVRNASGELRYFVGAQSDVTARRAVEAEREALRSRMAESSKFEALGTLAGGIAHEINTPAQFVSDNIRFLGSTAEPLLELVETATRLIAGQGGAAQSAFAEALARADVEFLRAEIPGAVAQCMDGMDRIGKIVQAVKEFSYPADREQALFDLNRTIEVAATVTRNQWKYVAELELDLAADLPHVPGDQGAINQVLLNMIVNAAHAIEEKGGDARGSIAISTRALSDGVEIRIADTGGGIPPEIRSRVFELFFTTKAPGRGTGQGLAISHAIVVKQHGGSITIDSEVGRGTTFVIKLPATVASSELEVAA